MIVLTNGAKTHQVEIKSKGVKRNMFIIPKNHILNGKLVLLRSVSPEDYLQLKELLNHQETMQALTSYFNTTIWSDEMIADRYSKASKDQACGYVLQYVVVDIQSQKVIGNCGFKNIDQQKSQAEYGILLHQSVWGSGVARDCFLLNLKYAFESLQLKKVLFLTDSKNKRMIGFFNKIGLLAEKKNEQDLLRFILAQSQWPQAEPKLHDLS